MNHLPIALLTATIAAVSPAVFAQERAPGSLLLAQSQSESLTTQPASVNRPISIPRPTNPPYTSEQLNSIANSVQLKRKKPEPSLIPIPEALRQEPVAPTPIDPLDFFKAPAPDRKIEVPVGRD